MKEKIQEIKSEYLERFESVSSLEELENLRVLMLGKKGKITDLMGLFREVPNEEKREVGKDEIWTGLRVNKWRMQKSWS